MSLYDDLGVAKDADAVTIKKAHRKRVKQTHPDNPDGNADSFRKVQNAYLVLSDPDRRKRYDDTGDEGQSSMRSPEEQEQTEALQALGGLVVQLLNEPDSTLDYTDLQKKLLSTIRATAQNFGADKSKTRTQIAKAEKVAKRWRKKSRSEEPDLIAAIMNSQIATLNQRVSEIERAERVNARLQAMVEGYEYDFEKKATTDPNVMKSLVGQIAREELGNFDPFNHPMFNKMNSNRR